jgi:hypothetical protein
MKRLSMVAVLALSACASYEPVRESNLSQLTSEGCSREGSQTLVNAFVNKATHDSVVIWDGSDPQSTVAARLPRPGIAQRLRNAFGESKSEVAAEKLNEVAQQRLPVTFSLVCESANAAPVVRSISYTDQQGQRVAIAY